jgi:tetratricopeptide (TPR) repeat protein
MLKRFYLLSFFFVINLNLKAQNLEDDLRKANGLYNEKIYSEAVLIYERLYKKKSTRVYNSYLDCLIKLSKIDSAIKLVKNYYKKFGKNPSILIDLGELYILQGNEDLAKNEFEKVLDEIRKKPNFIASSASKFYKKNLYDFALKAYKLAKEKNPSKNYSFQISNIYSQMGQVENMYKELLDLLITSPSYLQTCKVRFSRTINENPNNENNILLKKNIIRKIQKNENEELNDLLVWIYLQEKNFSDALSRLISLDKRFEFYDHKIFELGEIAKSNKELIIAEEAFKYLSKNKNYGIYYEESIIELLNIKYEKFKKSTVKTNNEIKEIVSEYEKVINLLGENNETIMTIIDMSHIISFYENDKQKAKNILLPLIENKNISSNNIAYIKLKLGDIFLSEGEKWDAILFYSQVEKEFKNDIIGQEAKLKKIKVDYFNGDFNWAQAQLDVLKKSTSKLVSNNSIELSLLITDNLNLDTTTTALEMFAQADLLIYQNNFEEAINLFNQIELKFPDHSLIDEILFKKALINIEVKKFEEALLFLDKICKRYGTSSIFYDDSLFKQGDILETIYMDEEKAKAKYEKILLEQPGSIFLAEARKRYRKLRKN